MCVGRGGGKGGVGGRRGEGWAGGRGWGRRGAIAPGAVISLQFVPSRRRSEPRNPIRSPIVCTFTFSAPLHTLVGSRHFYLSFSLPNTRRPTFVTLLGRNQCPQTGLIFNLANLRRVFRYGSSVINCAIYNWFAAEYTHAVRRKMHVARRGLRRNLITEEDVNPIRAGTTGTLVKSILSQIPLLCANWYRLRCRGSMIDR